MKTDLPTAKNFKQLLIIGLINSIMCAFFIGCVPFVLFTVWWGMFVLASGLIIIVFLVWGLSSASIKDFLIATLIYGVVFVIAMFPLFFLVVTITSPSNFVGLNMWNQLEHHFIMSVVAWVIALVITIFKSTKEKRKNLS